MKGILASRRSALVILLALEDYQANTGFSRYTTYVGNGPQPALDSIDSLATPSAGYVKGNRTLQNAVPGFGSPNAVYDNGPCYPLNDVVGPNVDYDHGNNAVQNTGYGGNPVNEILNPFGTTTAPNIVYDGCNNTANDAFNRDLSPLGGLTVSIGDYGQGNYTSEGGTYSGLYPVYDLGATRIIQK